MTKRARTLAEALVEVLAPTFPSAPAEIQNEFLSNLTTYIAHLLTKEITNV